MALLKDDKLAAEVRAGDIRRVYYLYGRDTARVKSFALRLIKKLCGKDDCLNLHRLDGGRLSMSELWDCCNMLPCFSDRVVTAVNGLNCESLNKDDLDYVCKIVERLPETSTLIFYAGGASGAELYKNKKYLTDKNERLNKLCQKIGCSCEFSFKTPSELAKTIIAAVNKAGCEISRDNACYLAQKCLCESEAVASELKKLTAYVSKGEITRETIDALCAGRLDADAFSLAGCILKGDADSAFRLIGELYDMQNPTAAIIGALSTTFSDVYRAKAALEGRRTASDIAADFNYPKNRTFALDRAMENCRHASLERLRRCVVELADADYRTKSSAVDSRIILERCVMLMLEK